MSPIIGREKAESEAIFEAARLMLVSARTAPKTAGIDHISALIIHGDTKDSIANEMDKTAEERRMKGFKRDAKNVRDSAAVVLIGAKGRKSAGLNCGACGYKTCRKFEATQEKLGRDFAGPTCLFKAMDLGIALGSAAKTAGIFNIDNRIMYRVGTAALKLKLLPEASVAIGIPISATGKNIYFDRKR